MSMSTLKVQTCALIFSALLTLPTFATAQENEPMTATSPESSQQGNMGNHMDMDHKGMMDKMGGMKNKADGKTHPNTTEPNNNTNSSMPMKDDM